MNSVKKYNNRKIMREVEKIKIKFGGMDPTSINNLSNKVNSGGFHNPADIVLYRIIESLFKNNQKQISEMFLQVAFQAVTEYTDIQIAFRSQ